MSTALLERTFCPTGPGGGVDPSCGGHLPIAPNPEAVQADEHTVQYHGTLEVNLKSILKEGIVPTSKKVFAESSQGGRSSKVFATTEKPIADWYASTMAMYAKDAKAVVFEIHVPKGVPADVDTSSKSSWMFDKIPPQWIKAVHIDGQRQELKAVQLEKMYVAALFSTTAKALRVPYQAPALLTETLHLATDLVKIKQRQLRSKIRRVVNGRVFERQFAETERNLINALIPFLKGQVEEIANAIGRGEKSFEKTFCPTGAGGGVDPSCGGSERKPLKRRDGTEYEDPPKSAPPPRSYLSWASIKGMHKDSASQVMATLDRLVSEYGTPKGLGIVTMSGGNAIGTAGKGRLRWVSTEEANQLHGQGEHILDLKVKNKARYYHDDKNGYQISLQVSGPRGGDGGYFGGAPDKFGKYLSTYQTSLRTTRGRLDDIVTHEFGHVLHYMAGSTPSGGQKAPANLEVAKIIKSEYAKINLGETVAEAFKYYDSGGRDPKVVSFLNENVFSRIGYGRKDGDVRSSRGYEEAASWSNRRGWDGFGRDGGVKGIRGEVRSHFDSDQAKQDLINTVFPILARGMSEAAVAQIMMLGIDVRKRRKSVKYPGQPRDDHGRFGSGSGGGSGLDLPDRGRDFTVYHGTSESAIASIKEHGLKFGVGNGADEWSRRNGWTVHEATVGARASSVYLAKSERSAMDFGTYAAEIHDSRVVVLSVRVPSSHRSKLKEDEQSGDLRFEGHIPPAWITEYSVVKGGGLIWIAFLITGKEEPTKTFCPTGPGGGVDPSCGSGSVIGGDAQSKARIASVLSDIENDWGKGAIPSKTTLEDKDVVTPPGGVHGERYGYYNQQNHEVVLAGSKLSFRTEPFAELGGNLVDASVEGALRHEIGHLVYKKMGEERRAGWDLVNKDHYVSSVASQNHEEYFAEAFSYASSRDHSRGELHPEVDSFFDSIRSKIKSFTKSTASQWLSSHQIATPPGIMTDLPQWMKDSIASHLSDTFDQPYWEKINQTTLDDIEGVLRTGLQEGESIATMAKKIKEELDDEYYHGRSKNIARTEAGNALNGSRKGAMDALRDAIPEVKMRAEWLSVLGTTTRAEHAHLDGVPEDKNGKWYLGGKHVPWPGHYSLPAGERVNCQCVPGDAVVEHIGGLIAVSKMLYDGPLVKFITKSGRVVHITPNHPVLTSCGWMLASELKVGVQVFSQDVTTEVFPGKYEHNKPARIEDLFESVSSTFAFIKRTTRLPFQFHGDAKSGMGEIETAVVGVELPNPPIAEVFKDRKERGLGLTTSKLCGSKHLLSVAVSPSKELRFVACPSIDPVFFEGSVDSDSCNRKSTGNRLDRCTSIEQGNSVNDAEHSPSFKVRTPNFGFGSIPEGDATINQPPSDGCVVVPKLTGDLCGTISCKVEPDDIIDIDFDLNFSGHVYDLQSEKQLYLCNGVIIHNCTLVTSYGLDEDAALEEIQQYQDRLDEYEERAVNQLMGKMAENQPRDDHGRFAEIGGFGFSVHGEGDASHPALIYSSFQTREEVERSFGKIEQAHAKRLSVEEKKAVQNYTEDASINEDLREGKSPDGTSELDSAIAKGKIPRRVSLSRYMVAPDDTDVSELIGLRGKTISDRAFTSTSIEDRSYEPLVNDFASTVFGSGGIVVKLRIKAERDSPGLLAGGVSEYSTSEVILPRNAKLRIMDVREVTNEQYKVGGRRTVIMEAHYAGDG